MEHSGNGGTMANQILTPDFNATVELDLVELDLKRTIQNADFVLSGEDISAELRTDAEVSRKAAQEALDKHNSNGTSPKVKIGYIPPRKLTTLRHKHYVLTRQDLKIEDATCEQLEELSDIQREYLRWGIKGHSGLDAEYKAEKDVCGPKEYNTASWDTVELYEGMGLLSALYTEVLVYNMLSEEKKRVSLSKPGTNPTTLTVASASKSPS